MDNSKITCWEGKVICAHGSVKICRAKHPTFVESIRNRGSSFLLSSQLLLLWGVRQSQSRRRLGLFEAFFRERRQLRCLPPLSGKGILGLARRRCIRRSFPREITPLVSLGKPATVGLFEEFEVLFEIVGLIKIFHVGICRNRSVLKSGTRANEAQREAQIAFISRRKREL